VVRSGRGRGVGVWCGFVLAVKLYGRQFSSDQTRRALGKAGQGRVRTEKWWRRSQERRGGGGEVAEGVGSE
jgi:hypothetical protein